MLFNKIFILLVLLLFFTSCKEQNDPQETEASDTSYDNHASLQTSSPYQDYTDAIDTNYIPLLTSTIALTVIEDSTSGISEIVIGPTSTSVVIELSGIPIPTSRAAVATQNPTSIKTPPATTTLPSSNTTSLVTTSIVSYPELYLLETNQDAIKDYLEYNYPRVTFKTERHGNLVFDLSYIVEEKDKNFEIAVVYPEYLELLLEYKPNDNLFTNDPVAIKNALVSFMETLARDLAGRLPNSNLYGYYYYNDPDARTIKELQWTNFGASNIDDATFNLRNAQPSKNISYFSSGSGDFLR